MGFGGRLLREAEAGFEPANNGFAIRPLSPLGYSALRSGRYRREVGVTSHRGTHGWIRDENPDGGGVQRLLWTSTAPQTRDRDVHHR